MHDNERIIRELLKAGARGYLLKSDAKHHLIRAIEALAVHKPFFTGNASEALLQSFRARPGREASTLTDRERGVVQLIAEGHTNKQVANALGIGLKTVETHRQRSCASSIFHRQLTSFDTRSETSSWRRSSAARENVIPFVSSHKILLRRSAAPSVEWSSVCGLPPGD
jgi:hypothetical protein